MGGGTCGRVRSLYRTRGNRVALKFAPNHKVTVFADICPGFRGVYPDVRIRPVRHDIHSRRPLLLSNRLSLNFVALAESRRGSKVVCRALTSRRVILTIPAGLIATLSVEGNSLTLLERRPFILARGASAVQRVISSVFGGTKFAPGILFRASGGRTVVSVVRRGVYYKVLPVCCVSPRSRTVACFRLPSRPS